MNVSKIFKNTYFDSVSLMSETAKLKKELPVEELILLMGSEMNKDMIRDVGLYDSSMDEATPNDLIMAAELTDESIKDTWHETIMERLSDDDDGGDEEKTTYKTIAQAKKHFDANFVMVSVPGTYAADEAYEALERDMHVMLFSDNVALEDEIALKDLALEKDLLMMGPDCGTAIINGKGLAFANDVKQGNIGLVAASGTGLQEVSVIIDRFGGGITQAIGVGGRDLSKDVGGRMMLKGIDVLADDENTDVIVLISKPPHPDVEEKILERVKAIDKPVILGLLDAAKSGEKDNVTYATTLSDAAFKALEKAGIDVDASLALDDTTKQNIEKAQAEFKDSQTKIKGLFCGGTLTSETLSILRKEGLKVTSNVAKKDEEKMDDPFKSEGHNLVDLGEDVFTEGKPHPMIEPTIRLERMIEEAKNEETAVILLDFELGYGSHEDPVGITIDTIKVAKEQAAKDNRKLAFVAYVCGTKTDFQGLKASEKLLEEEGVILARTNAQAAKIASELVKGRE